MDPIMCIVQMAICNSVLIGTDGICQMRNMRMCE